MIRFLRRLCLAVAMAATAMVPASADDGANLEWLELEPATLSLYDVTVEPDDPARMTAIPANAAPGAEMKRVMLLIPSRSVVAYSAAVNTILRGFDARGVSTRFDIWYYHKDRDRAARALSWAYEQPMDMIMSVGSKATSYLYAYHTGHAIPAVSSAAKDPVAMGQVKDAKAGSGTNIAYTSINVETETLVAYLRELVPGLDTVGLLYDTSNSSAVLTQVNPLKEASQELGLTVVDITVDGADSATAQLESNLPAGLEAMRQADPQGKRSVLLVTGSTAVYERIRQINRHAGTLPVISMLPDVVREGEDSALLSIGVNITSALKLATVYALDVITGKADPGALPVGRVSPPDLAINFRVARKIGVRIPFSFLESSTFVYDFEGRAVIAFGQRVGEG